jgi:hypothetical protein
MAEALSVELACIPPTSCDNKTCSEPVPLRGREIRLCDRIRIVQPNQNAKFSANRNWVELFQLPKSEGLLLGHLLPKHGHREATPFIFFLPELNEPMKYRRTTKDLV